MAKEYYLPRGETQAVLDRAWQLVQSVPYQVSARWVFYRLLQEGYYSHKSDYKNKWVKAVSSARHAFYNGWRPDTLSDETREAIIRGRGFDTVEGWLNAVSERLSCTLDKWNTQEYYLELWYEARAMSDQFRHYTQHITLRPMAGQPSIPYKWQIAKGLEEAARSYELPIIILYFGDLDTAGETISDVVERDVREWCSVDFEFIRCGLSLDQVRRYGVPENPEKPGEYQWEALSDAGAREVITGNVDQYLHHGAFVDVEHTEELANDWIRQELVGLEGKWQDYKAD